MMTAVDALILSEDLRHATLYPVGAFLCPVLSKSAPLHLLDVLKNRTPAQLSYHAHPDQSLKS